MKKLPTVELDRLILRPFILEDAKLVQEYAGDMHIAKTTLNIPHPYEEGIAEEWINKHAEAYEAGKSLTLAIVNKKEKYLIGSISIFINKKFKNGELGYWIAKQYWNNGYCTEAAKGLLKYCFNEMNLNRIYACYLGKNPASGIVMKKIGMKYEGVLRQHVKKWGEYEDLFYYGILKNEYKL